jgi:predicted DCC family thiol-disulfide oxidoreductase YuxK
MSESLYAPTEHAVVLYDGVCGLCHWVVQFILRHDKVGYFNFAALQSVAGEKLLRAYGLSLGEFAQPDSVVVIENGKALQKSEAAFVIIRKMAYPYKLMRWLAIVPRPIADAVYDWVARNRYRWFGKFDTCALPDPQHKARFLA